MIKQVFFDLDGVIFDSYQIWDDLVNHLLALKSLSLTDQIQDQLWSLSMSEADTYLSGLLISEFQAQDIADIKHQLLIDGYAHVTLMKNAKKTIEKLAEMGFQLYAITSNYKQIAEIGLRSAGIFDYFTDVLSVMDTFFEDKHAAYFQYIANEYHFDLEKIPLVEDSISNLKAAKSVNMKTIYYQNNLYTIKPEDYSEVDIILNDLSELPAIIEKHL